MNLLLAIGIVLVALAGIFELIIGLHLEGLLIDIVATPYSKKRFEARYLELSRVTKLAGILKVVAIVTIVLGALS